MCIFCTTFPLFAPIAPIAISDVTNLTRVKSDVIGEVNKGTETTQMKT